MRLDLERKPIFLIIEKTSQKRNLNLKEIGIALGQRVAHKTFGEGVVLNYEGSGEAARVQINFSKAGTKWLVMAYANLEKL